MSAEYREPVFAVWADGEEKKHASIGTGATFPAHVMLCNEATDSTLPYARRQWHFDYYMPIADAVAVVDCRECHTELEGRWHDETIRRSLAP